MARRRQVRNLEILRCATAHHHSMLRIAPERRQGNIMAFRQRREKLRAILTGLRCIRPGSVYDATSIRIAEDLGFEVGMFGGSVASLAVLGDPDIALITLTELGEQMRRMSRASVLPVLVDADHGYGNALNVRRTISELEAAGAGGLPIEDTLLPLAYCVVGGRRIC